MPTRTIGFVLLALAALSVPTLAVEARKGLDQVRKTDGSTVNGSVVSITPTRITVEERSGGQKAVSVNEIAMITFDGDPGPLKTARNHGAQGRYEEALGVLENVKPDELKRKEALADYLFLKAYSNAKLALAGTGPLNEAGSQMFAFCRENQNSYHFLEACETLGDLFVASRKYENATEWYGRLAQAPWPDYKMRAGLAMGRALLAQKKSADAVRAVDSVLTAGGEGEQVDLYKALANLGKIRCQIETAKPDEVVKQIEAVILKADADRAEVLAPAYNVLGAALRKAGKDKEALMAFLRVDVLYATQPDAHAEALANLAELWNKQQQTERAVRARQTLEERYPNSPWARR